MRLFAVAIALLAGLPAFAAGQVVQVRLDATLLTGPASMPDRAEIKNLLPKGFKAFGVIRTRDAEKLAELAREKCDAKLLAEPKMVTLSGRPVDFLAGGQQAVLKGTMGPHGPEVRFEEVGTNLSLLPREMKNGHIYLEARVRVRNVNQQRGMKTEFGFVPSFDERSLTAALKLDAGQSMVVADRCEHGAQLIIVTPTIFTVPPEIVNRAEPVAVAAAQMPFAVSPAPMPAPADQAKHVAMMLVREYQQACAANNAELATKLAHMAVELHPMCFNVVPPVAVTVDSTLLHYKPTVKPDCNLPLEKHLATEQGCARLSPPSENHQVQMLPQSKAKQNNEHRTLLQRIQDFSDLFTDLGTLIRGELPSSFYLEHKPQYFRPDPESPLEK